MPSQIEIANSLHHPDIFQLAAHKGQPPHLKAEAGGAGGAAVVTTGILAASTASYQCIINSECRVLRKQRYGLRVRSLATPPSLSANRRERLVFGIKIQGQASVTATVSRAAPRQGAQSVAPPSQGITESRDRDKVFVAVKTNMLAKLWEFTYSRHREVLSSEV
ncbi:unnamed protein product [Pleuronectes platessa]|uniref:Uncharacterized protein n=1 Tax=Pleuronectes platessa TaxID=8262 RepID=A0A9N7Y805_PLEPL|nr:unnamed protein product [Pleuronectes platessa]